MASPDYIEAYKIPQKAGSKGLLFYFRDKLSVFSTCTVFGYSAIIKLNCLIKGNYNI
jgi:hypothetical protein